MAQLDSDEADLDAEELMHLALKAMGQGREEEALLLLRRGLAQEPENGMMLYLQGGLHAQLGMVERAIEELTLATQLSPEIGTAHFQLGMLHMARADLAQAHAAWAPLDQLDEDDALRIFKQGMVKFLAEEYAEAVALLKRGLASDDVGPALHKNVTAILGEIEKIRAEGQTTGTTDVSATGQSLPPGSAEKKQPATPSQHVLLSGYRK